MYTLDSIPLSVYGAADFDFADTIARQRLIGDGSADQYNEVIQSGALGNRMASFQCRVQEFDDLEAIKELRAAASVVAFVDRHGLTHQVIVAEVTNNEMTFLWEVTLTLIEVQAPSLAYS